MTPRFHIALSVICILAGGAGTVYFILEKQNDRYGRVYSRTRNVGAMILLILLGFMFLMGAM